ncbi:hypothetical protein SNEBB_003574 [Seison nebaliae]|nr:hypothetical protein SNEBB_003574 [Seison nebaliae]
MTKHQIAIVGSGNWGSTIARIVGWNVKKYPDIFSSKVTMYVYEEMIDGDKLTNIINTKHENVKYLPGYRIPDNVIALPNIVDTVQTADILIFVVPHQFVPRLCNEMKGNIKKDAFALSLIKGIDINTTTSGLMLVSDHIRQILNIKCSVLMGANIASEVAAELFCETTIGSHEREHGRVFKKLLETPYFRIKCVENAEVVELCGALKNIVACAAGMAEGLDYKDNTKAAIIRIGLMEMIEFCKLFYTVDDQTVFLESCGIADLVTTCYGGRNRRVSSEFARTGKDVEVLESEMLNGQKLQGPQAAHEVYKIVMNMKMEKKFPLFCAVHLIFVKEMKVHQLINELQDHPVHVCL